MNKIIPSPQYMFTSSKHKKVYKECLNIFINCQKAESLDSIISIFSKKLLNFQVSIRYKRKCFTSSLVKDIILTDSIYVLKKILSEKDRMIFTEEKYAMEQGYVLISNKNLPIIIYAKKAMGFVYGLSTLLQVITYKKEEISIPNMHIRDYPSFRYRSNNWLTWAECGVWSYDWGDGLEAFKKRIIDRLDFSLLHKVNLIVFEGFGWSLKRFSGYASLMRELNKAARIRGIHLMFTGYTSSYGASGRGLYYGEVFKNRETYPNGKSYSCINKNVFCDHHAGAERGGYLGTCLSNKKLTQLKIKELVDFVDKVEPGALYLHNIDIESLDICEKAWQKRCHKCREKWQDDNILSENGMAGAFAYFYSQIARAVNSIKKTDYNPEKDCLILNVSPGYSIPEDGDETWELTLKYWSVVSKYMDKNSNVKITVREQFHNYNSDKLRIAQLNKALKKEKNGHEIAIALFYGADGAYNDFNFLCNSSMNYLYTGAEVLMTNSGNAYQEPLQLFNAECSWNTNAGKRYTGEIFRTKKEDYKIFNKLKHSKIYPEKVFGENAFLKNACQQLYGECAEGMFKIFSLRGKNNECAVPYVWHMQFGITPFQKREICWQNQLDKKDILVYLSRYSEMTMLNQKALIIIGGLPHNPARKEEFKWLKKSYKLGYEYSLFFQSYVNIYIEAFYFFKSGNGSVKELSAKIKKQIQLIEKIIKEIAKIYKPIDVYGGAWGLHKETSKFLLDNYKQMSDSLNTGKLQIKKDENTWW